MISFVCRRRCLFTSDDFIWTGNEAYEYYIIRGDYNLRHNRHTQCELWRSCAVRVRMVEFRHLTAWFCVCLIRSSAFFVHRFSCQKLKIRKKNNNNLSNRIKGKTTEKHTICRTNCLHVQSHCVFRCPITHAGWIIFSFFFFFLLLFLSNIKSSSDFPPSPVEHLIQQFTLHVFCFVMTRNECLGYSILCNN